MEFHLIFEFLLYNIQYNHNLMIGKLNRVDYGMYDMY